MSKSASVSHAAQKCKRSRMPDRQILASILGKNEKPARWIFGCQIAEVEHQMEIQRVRAVREIGMSVDRGLLSSKPALRLGWFGP